MEILLKNMRMLPIKTLGFHEIVKYCLKSLLLAFIFLENRISDNIVLL